jgi:hypothetical protein
MKALQIHRGGSGNPAFVHFTLPIRGKFPRERDKHISLETGFV